MKFKIDENLPAECAGLLRRAGFGAETVADEGMTGEDDSVLALAVRSEGRALITLDLGFANVRAYPPAGCAGIVVLRLKQQDKPSIVDLMTRLVAALATRNPSGELWIVERDRIRFRAG